eukprot:gnl/MRDRNA2_/MRDRNA2_15769_c0_seq1.p1 gnl/MRDRNA2_/MRDRNA2_15769_c0~~gnl/MRDRNA2_/MRDRNA2_15769_c0_seq1.p1  ORF type:complete len:667 (+),score=94.25 gnl/MRDRNA2_/MRDRNA2_15769_c0_seq1:242-2002(+)
MGHKDLHDVHSIADIYSWLRVGLRPLIFRSSKSFSELSSGEAFAWPTYPVPTSEKPFYLQYNRIVGGVQLQQKRTEPRTCSVSIEFAKAYDLACDMHLETSSHYNLNLQPEVLDITSAHPDFDDTLWFLLSQKPDEVDQRLIQLELSDWISNATVQVAINFMTYNGHHGTLTLTECHFFFSRSGQMWKKIVNSSFFLEPYKKPGVFVFDALFVGIIAYFFFREVLEIIDIGRRNNWKCIWFRKYINVWNAIDWIVILFGVALMVLYGIFVAKTSNLKIDLQDLAGYDDGVMNFAESMLYEARIEKVTAKFRDTVYLSILHLRIGVAYLLALVLRMFKAFDAQPRLALVTRTLSHAAVDIAHFGLVLLAILLTYVVMSTTLFGTEISEFSTFMRTVHSCFRALLGDVDADAMNEAGRPFASIWYWSFSCLIVLVMMNMLMSIIMDAYSEVKAGAESTQTLLDEICNHYQRWLQWRRGEGLTLAFVAKELQKKFGVIDMHKDWENMNWEVNDCLMPKDLLNSVDGIGRAQAVQLMEQTVKSWRLSHQKPIALYDAMVAFHGLKKQMQQLLEHMNHSNAKLNPTLVVRG